MSNYAAGLPVVDNYESANRFLGGKDQRRYAHNTWVERTHLGGSIAVRYHGTHVVIFYPDGTLRLNTGGWDTVTTVLRMHHHTPMSVVVNRREGSVYATVDGGQPQLVDPTLDLLAAPA